MSSAVYIVLDQEDPGFDLFVNGKAMARHAEAVEQIAREADLRTLDDFCSFSDEDFAGLEEELAGVLDEAPEEEWFEPEAGLEWAAALRRAIETRPEALPEAEAVLQDLAEYEEIWRKARECGARWHFSIDY